MHKFDSREEHFIRADHPIYIQGSEAWANGTLVADHPFEPFQLFCIRAWSAGWTDADRRYSAKDKDEDG